MIAPEIQDALNEQINQEYCSWYFYRSAAAHCREKNLMGFSKWLCRQSEKKLDRANGLADFVLQRRGHVEVKPIDFANGHWDRPLGILDAALERERHFDRSVTNLVDLAAYQGDHATRDILQRVASDQVEAEAKLETIRDRLKMVAETPAGLFMVDRDLA